MNIKVSIIILAYNAEKHITRILDNLMGQSLKEIEIIVVNNASQDRTEEILQDYASADPRIRVISRTVNNFSGGWNDGIAVAQGEYLLISGDDDWWDEDCFDRAYAKAKDLEVDMLVFNRVNEYEDELLREEVAPVVLDFTMMKKFPEVFTGIDLFQENLLKKKHFLFSLVSTFLRRDFVQKEGIQFYRDLHYGSDFLFFIHSLIRAKRVSFEPKVSTHHFIRYGSSMRNAERLDFYRDLHTRNLYVYCVELCQLFHQYQINEKEHPLILEYLTSCQQSFLNLYIRSHDTKESFLAFESLLHHEQILNNKPCTEMTNFIITPEEIIEKRDEFTSLCFFGGGKEAKKTLAFFKEKKLPFPVAICDNNTDLQGKEIEGIPVISLASAKAQYPDIHILVTNQANYYWMILQAKELLGTEKVFKLFL